jgi:hypothetical protein
VIESTSVRGIFELADEFDFSTDETVAQRRPADLDRELPVLATVPGSTSQGNLGNAQGRSEGPLVPSTEMSTNQRSGVMQIRPKTVVALGATLAVVASGGAALAAQNSGPSLQQDRQQFLSDVSNRLGVSQSDLSDALQGAAIDRVNADQKAGRLTQKQAEQIKQQIQSGDVPPVGGPPPGAPPGGPGEISSKEGPIAVASSYLGISTSEVQKDLESGKTLADLADQAGKSVDGLKSALRDDLRSHLDKQVSSGEMSSKQEQQILDGFDSHVDDIVNGKGPVGPPPPPMGGNGEKGTLPPPPGSFGSQGGNN